jgi:hypothetical protein
MRLWINPQTSHAFTLSPILQPRRYNIPPATTHISPMLPYPPQLPTRNPALRNPEPGNGNFPGKLRRQQNKLAEIQSVFLPGGLSCRYLWPVCSGYQSGILQPSPSNLPSGWPFQSFLPSLPLYAIKPPHPSTESTAGDTLAWVLQITPGFGLLAVYLGSYPPVGPILFSHLSVYRPASSKPPS